VQKLEQFSQKWGLEQFWFRSGLYPTALILCFLRNFYLKTASHFSEIALILREGLCGGKQLAACLYRLVLVVSTLALSSQISMAAPKSATKVKVPNPKYAAIVIDAHSGKTLYQENANAKRYPASLTKMMTLYMLFEAMQTGRIAPETPIPVSEYASQRPPTKIGFKPGNDNGRRCKGTGIPFFQ